MCPISSLFSFESHLSLSLSPTLCEITVAIVTQQIGLAVTAVVGAMATHICLCFTLSTCAGCTHTHFFARYNGTLGTDYSGGAGGNSVKSFCKWLMIYAAHSVHFVSVPRLCRTTPGCTTRCDAERLVAAHLDVPYRKEKTGAVDGTIAGLLHNSVHPANSIQIDGWMEAERHSSLCRKPLTQDSHLSVVY